MDLLNPTSGDILIYLLVFIRTVSILALLPVFGATNLPFQLIIGFALVLSVIMFPYAKGLEAVVIPPSIPAFIILVLKEIFVGVMIGYVVSFLFVSVQFAGTLIDSQIGFGFAQVVDPISDMETTVTGQLQMIIFTIVFLLINGHYFLILAIQKSFAMIPLLGVKIPGGQLVEMFTVMVSGIFVSAIQFAAPIMVTLTLMYVALGVISRTVPQLNVFFVGMPLAIVIGLGTLILVFPLLTHLFITLFNNLMKDLWRLLYLLA